MAGVKVFTDLQIWKRARSWSKTIFEHTEDGPFAGDYRLRSQINDSSASVMANIAEGFSRGTQAEFINFRCYAIASLNETQSHLCAAYDRRYVNRDAFGKLFQEGTEIRKMTVGFMQSMVLHGSGVKHCRKTQKWTRDTCERFERLTGKPPLEFVEVE